MGDRISVDPKVCGQARSPEKAAGIRFRLQLGEKGGSLAKSG
jgi:hypothetical protein